ncbi:MAG: NAD(+)/NADH kinase [Nitrospiraceae bacterium]|nr:NAD(+)/NADH kinase [Nitrospiraceae bacterium]
MKKIGIIAKEGRSEPIRILEELLPWIEEKGFTCLVDEEAAKALAKRGYPRAEIAELADLIITLGGDGTILSVARLVCARGVPILGVNLGGLGFITEVGRERVKEAVEKALACEAECPVEERMMLAASIKRHGELIAEYSVLNDVVINKGASQRIIDIEAYVNGALMTTFRADGLIASTPTGSTAYCLSAGGPVLYPTVAGIVLTPICSHTLAMRPIVLPQEVRIEIKPVTKNVEVYLSLDGQVGFNLREKDVVLVTKSPHKAKLLMPFERDYFQVLREKLRWGSR